MLSRDSSDIGDEIDDTLPLYEQQVWYIETGDRFAIGKPLRESLRSCIHGLDDEQRQKMILSRLEKMASECLHDAKIPRYVLGAHFLGKAWQSAGWPPGFLPKGTDIHAQFDRTFDRSAQKNEFSKKALELYEDYLYGTNKPTPSAHLIGGIGTAFYYLSQFVLVLPDAYREWKKCRPDADDSSLLPIIAERSLQSLTHRFGRFDMESFKAAAHAGAAISLPKKDRTEVHVPQRGDQFVMKGEPHTSLQLPITKECGQLKRGLRCIALYAKSASGKSVFDDLIIRFLTHWKKTWLPLLLKRHGTEGSLLDYSSEIHQWVDKELDSLRKAP